MYNDKEIHNIINEVILNDDCNFLIFGINKDGILEYFKSYNYLQSNEIISDMKHYGYKSIKKIKIKKI